MLRRAIEVAVSINPAVASGERLISRPRFAGDFKKLPDTGQGVVDPRCVHIEVRDKAQTNEPGGQHAMCFEVIKQGSATAIGHVDKHDVGLGRAHRQPRDTLQTIGQSACIRMVVCQAIHVVFQRVQGSASQKPGLAQTAARHFADTPGPLDQRPRPAQG